MSDSKNPTSSGKSPKCDSFSESTFSQQFKDCRAPLKCLDGTYYDKPRKTCIVNPTCPSGMSWDDTRADCKANVTECTDSHKFSKEHNICYDSAKGLCDPNYVYNNKTKMCDYTPPVEKNKLYTLLGGNTKWECVAANTDHDNMNMTCSKTANKRGTIKPKFGFERIDGNEYNMFVTDGSKKGKTYCRTWSEHDGAVTCNESSTSGNAQEFRFNIVKAGKDTISIKNYQGKFCSDDSNRIQCNRDAVNTWEIFSIRAV